MGWWRPARGPGDGDHLPDLQTPSDLLLTSPSRCCLPNLHLPAFASPGSDASLEPPTGLMRQHRPVVVSLAGGDKNEYVS